MLADAQITFLPCADLERSRDFYGRVLGLTLVVDQGTCLIFRVSADAYIGVCERTEPDPGVGTITTFVTDDVDAWCAEIVDRGGMIDSGPEHSDTYRIHHAFLRDPDGNVLEIQRFDDPDWAAGP